MVDYPSRDGDLEIEPAEWRLGVVQANQAFELVAKVTNHGSESFQIDQVATNCPCLRFQFSRNLIKPGESGEVKVLLKATTRGFRRHPIRISLRDREETVEAKLHYSLLPTVSFEPAVLDLGRLEPGETRTVEFDAFVRVAADHPAVELNPTWSERLPATVELGEVQRREHGRGREIRRRVTVTVESTGQQGRFDESIVFDGEHLERSGIRVKGTFAASWWLSSDAVHFGVLGAGDEARQRVTLHYDQDEVETPTVEVVEKPEAIQLGVKARADRQEVRLNFHFQPKGPATLDDWITLKLSCADQPVRIRLQARGR